MTTDATDRPKQHIEIPHDVLIPDQEFCDVVLDGANTRTARRLEAEGLPFMDSVAASFGRCVKVRLG